MKDMKGYPMVDLDAPEVTGLKNGFQNAFSIIWPAISSKLPASLQWLSRATAMRCNWHRNHDLCRRVCVRLVAGNPAQKNPMCCS